MPYVQPTHDFLSSIDAQLVQYSGLLNAKGFSNTRLLAHLTFQDVMELPIGHRRLLINEVTKLRSPHSKGLLTALDAHNIQSDCSPSGNTVLEPKELFPKTPAKPKDQRIESYTYMTPMQKHLNTLQRNIELKEQEMEKVKIEIDSLDGSNNDYDSDSRPHCSICHEVGHRRNRCSGQKCPASVSCGKLKLHKDELKHQDTLKANLRKLVKEKLSLDAECEKISETINMNNKSFAQAVRGYLINSNKHKYLTTYAEQVVPLTKVINYDLSILQKHYHNRVPDNLSEESDLFASILDPHQSNVPGKCGTSLNAKLQESLSKVDHRISLPSGTNYNAHLLGPSPQMTQPSIQTRHVQLSDSPISGETSVPPQVPSCGGGPPNRHVPFLTSQPPPPPSHPQYITEAANVDNSVFDLSRQFHGLHSPPTKIQRLVKSDDIHFAAPSDPTSITPNPFYSLPRPIYTPPIYTPRPPSLQIPTWHKPDFSVVPPPPPNPNFHYPGQPLKPHTVSFSSPDDAGPPVKSGTGDSPPVSGPIDYSIGYELFNLKPKTALANRYSDESTCNVKPKTELNEPELD